MSFVRSRDPFLGKRPSIRMDNAERKMFVLQVENISALSVGGVVHGTFFGFMGSFRFFRSMDAGRMVVFRSGVFRSLGVGEQVRRKIVGNEFDVQDIKL